MSTNKVGTTNLSPSHTIELGLRNYTARKCLYALTLEKDAYIHWQQIHNYMSSKMKPNYTLICEHDGPDYPHIHCLYQYKNAKIIHGDRLFGAHIETKVWSPQKYVEYCKGLDKKHTELGINSTILIEDGELRKSGGFHTIGEVKKMSIEEINELPAPIHNIAVKIYEEEHAKQSFFEMLSEIKNNELKKINVIYAHGDSGYGKTYGAYKLALEKYEIEEIGRISIHNGFFKFDNPNAKCFVIEEFRSSQLPASNWLQFTDKYGYNCPTKGGFQYCRPEMLIICSIIKPQELYSEEHSELNQQFIRRITEYYEVDEEHNWHQKLWSEEYNDWIISLEDN